jgi:hypothetical protein
MTVSGQRQRQAEPDPRDRRLCLELRPARLVGSVVNAYDMTVTHRTQARTVVELVLQSVYLGGHLVTTRDGYRPPIRLHCHPAQYAAVNETSRKYGHLLKKLLDAFRAEQRILQFNKILPVILRFINHEYTRYLMRDLAHPRVIISTTYYPLAAAQTPASRLAALTLVAAFVSLRWR